MKKNDPRYLISQSPFYRLQTKKKLAELLEFDVSSFDAIVSDNNYRVFQNKKKRWIQCPINELRPIHDRIQTFMARIALPDYVHSQKGRSYITNALKHSAELPFLKTDISKFYPSTSFSDVFNLFYAIFECSRDVAWHLARFCCYQGRSLPTGSPLSGSIAFHSHQPMFNEIASLANSKKGIFTLFVDDLGISGMNASRALLYQIRGIIRKHGLTTSDAKSKTYGVGRSRKITGVLMTIDGPKVPNIRLLKTHQMRKNLESMPSNKKSEKLKKSLRGSVQEAQEIEKANKEFSINGKKNILTVSPQTSST